MLYKTTDLCSSSQTVPIHRGATFSTRLKRKRKLSISRAVVVICRDEQVAAKLFGIPPEDGEGVDVIFTRTGRRLFEERKSEATGFYLQGTMEICLTRC